MINITNPSPDFFDIFKEASDSLFNRLNPPVVNLSGQSDFLKQNFHEDAPKFSNQERDLDRKFSELSM